MEEIVIRKWNEEPTFFLLNMIKFVKFIRNHLIYKLIIYFFIGLITLVIPTIIFFWYFFYKTFNLDHNISKGNQRKIKDNTQISNVSIELTNAMSGYFINLLILFSFTTNFFFSKLNKLFFRQQFFNFDFMNLLSLISHLILLLIFLLIAIKANLIIFTIQSLVSDKKEDLSDNPIQLLYTIFLENFSTKIFPFFSSMLSFFLLYLIFAFLKTLFILSHCFISKLILIFTNITFILYIIIGFKTHTIKSTRLKIFGVLDICAYLGFIGERVLFQFKKKKFDMGFKIEKVFNLLTTIGIFIFALMIEKIANTTEASVNGLNSHLKLLKYSVYMIVYGLSIEVGKTLMKNLIYPIEKRYFTYKNEQLGKYIKKVYN